MKKKLGIFLLIILAAALTASLTACDFGGEPETYELTEVSYNPSGQSNEAWIYVDGHEQYATNKGDSARLEFNFKFKSAGGKEYENEFDLFVTGGESDYVLLTVTDKGTSIKLNYSTAEIPSSVAAKEIPVNVTFSQSEGSLLKVNENVTVTVDIDVVKAIKDYDVSFAQDFKTSYNRGEDLDLTGANLDLTYHDDSSESIPFAEALEMPQFKGSKVYSFDTETVGLRKNMSFSINIQDKGSKTKSAAYKVLPGAGWSAETAANIDYYKQEGMVVNTENYNDLDFQMIELPDSDVIIKMAYDKNYDYTAISPSASAYQSIINEGLTTQYPLCSAFNALIPAGQTATVSSVATVRGTTAVEYELTNGTKCTMYVIMTFFTGSINNQKVITITVQNSGLLTDTEKAAVLDFVSLVTIK